MDQTCGPSTAEVGSGDQGAASYAVACRALYAVQFDPARYSCARDVEYLLAETKARLNQST